MVATAGGPPAADRVDLAALTRGDPPPAAAAGGAAREGEALPSVRAIAADLSVNPLTVSRAYDALVDLGVVESRRGMGMFVAPGAREKLLAHERETFLPEDVPRLRTRP